MPAAAFAEERDYCPTRPGLGTTPCTIDTGHVSVELGLADWTRDDQPDSVTDDISYGEALARIGVAHSVEVQVGFTSFATQRVRDKASGLVSRDRGAGDLLLGAKINLHHPDGGGFALAAQPFVTAPVGRGPAAAGDWGAGLVLPMTYDLGHGLSAQFTGEVDAAVNASGSGRHLAYSGVWGLGLALAKGLSTTAEVQLARDDDPSGGSTASLAGLSFAWVPARHWQLDIGGAVGLNRVAPDGRLYFGVSHLF